MNNSVWKLLGLVLVSVLVAGCGSGPRLYKAGGTVTYNDKPVDKAAITFVYEDGASASGMTDAAGKFQLVYLGKTAGTAAGKGSMMVTKMSGQPATGSTMPAVKDPLKMTDEEKKKLSATAQSSMPTSSAATPPTMELPAKYADPAKSGLNFEILPNNDNNLEVVLKD